MKRLCKRIFIGGVLCLLLLFLANIGICWQHPTMQQQDPTVVGATPYPPSTCTPLFPWAPPPGPQKWRPQNSRPRPGLICFDNGCSLGACLLRLDAQVGYGHFGLDFILRPSVNFVASPGGTPPTGLCLSLTDSNVPIGSIEAGIGFRSGLFLSSRFQGAGASKPRSATEHLGWLGLPMVDT
jgi:hypothetical protein